MLSGALELCLEKNFLAFFSAGQVEINCESGGAHRKVFLNHRVPDIPYPNLFSTILRIVFLPFVN